MFYRCLPCVSGEHQACMSRALCACPCPQTPAVPPRLARTTTTNGETAGEASIQPPQRVLAEIYGQLIGRLCRRIDGEQVRFR